MEQWLQFRSNYLHILLKMEGKPASDRCSMCIGQAVIKCPDCFGSPSFCKDCGLESHRCSPFHRPLLWTMTHYTQVSLQSLGFAHCLGRGGAPCPKTVEPVVSDTLYSTIDITMESNNTGANRTRTAASGNPLFTVIDRSGIFNMEVVFCVCSDGGDTDEQLLRARLFPATFKQIETLFTHSVLEDFLTDNLECKTTAQQYYSKLQSMTSKMFPNNVPNRYKQLLRASRQWRDLKNRMQTGLGHQSTSDATPDGAMAIFCPACPQPGINLPKDWKMQEQLIRTFIMDGNFSAEHMRHRSGEKEVSLSPGMAFMANPASYKAHLRSGKETTQPSTCNTYKAIEQANSNRAHLDVTGIGAAACCHGFFVPTSVVDFQKGERQINMDYSICRALSYNMEDIPVALVMYDIMCQYSVHFRKRVENSPELTLPSSLELWTGIGLFHIHGHQDSCLPRFSPSYIPGAKQVDGEIIETLWAPLNNISCSLRGMSLVHRQEVLDAHINHSNWKKLVRIVPSLLKRFRRLETGFDASAQAYKSLSDHFGEKTEIWLKEDKDAQANRQASPSSMDIYDTVKEKAPSRATIQQELMGEEIGDSSMRGQTSWISCGIKIQEMQLAIRYQLRSEGAQFTIEDEQILENKRTQLQKLIDTFEHQADAFLFNDELSEDIPMSPLGDYSEYDHADDIDDSGVPGQSNAPPSGHHHGSHHSGQSGHNAEDIQIRLPSSLGWDWCLKHGHRSLAIKESKLHHSQAMDSIHKLRLALGFKSALFQTQVRHARTQKTKTRAWTAVHGVDATVHDHAQNYSMARDAYNNIQDPSAKSKQLPPLQLTDLQVNTIILGVEKRGQRNQQLPWIWSFGISAKKDGTWMDDFNRVHWLRAKAQFERWKEEQDSIHNEALWVPAYFHAKAEFWKALRKWAVQDRLPGHAAYASYQAHSWEELSQSSKKTLAPITLSSLKHV
ncbi:hypothetical protein EI94DRAFT_1608583 [Lactarius quietus]|nr:hypothetical protein EI94DRAFT_1608583 [Lactarius quietus]